jgi:hypothetical protein
MKPFLRFDPSIHHILHSRHAGTWDVRRTGCYKMTLQEMNDAYEIWEEQNDCKDEGEGLIFMESEYE